MTKIQSHLSVLRGNFSEYFKRAVSTEYIARKPDFCWRYLLQGNSITDQKQTFQKV